MPFSLKDLTKYSGFLAVGFWAIALFNHPTESLNLEFIAQLKGHGSIGIFAAFALAFILSFFAVGTAWGWRYIDHVYLDDRLIPCLAALFLP